jgi:hypothetical protein
LLLANHIEFTKYTERSSSYGIIWGSWDNYDIMIQFLLTHGKRIN